MTSPTPFTPPSSSSTRPDSETMSHLLALPPLLSPISPSLAALHMARVRLLLDLPTSRQVGKITDWWCHTCGGLREGLGGTSSASSRVKASRGKGKKTSSRTKKGPTGKEETASGLQRKNPECSCCGAKYKRGRPVKESLITYPSARIAARRKREEQIEDVFTAPTTGPSDAVHLVSTDTPIEPSIQPPESAIPSIATSASTPVKSRSPPSFNRVKVTEPNLPTYPPPQPSALSPEKPKKKKAKKSGLAKLLAENKERAAAQNLGGSWGLG